MDICGVWGGHCVRYRRRSAKASTGTSFPLDGLPENPLFNVLFPPPSAQLGVLRRQPCGRVSALSVDEALQLVNNIWDSKFDLK